jgi:hypothetical protein
VPFSSPPPPSAPCYIVSSEANKPPVDLARLGCACIMELPVLSLVSLVPIYPPSLSPPIGLKGGLKVSKCWYSHRVSTCPTCYPTLLYSSYCIHFRYPRIFGLCNYILLLHALYSRSRGRSVSLVTRRT